MDEEFYRRQRELMGEVIADHDVVITTAAVPGKKAPILVTKEMVAAHAPGSVIVDIAAERGGNCELTRPGETVDRPRSHDSRPAQSPLDDSLSREPDVLAQHRDVSQPPAQRRASSR